MVRDFFKKYQIIIILFLALEVGVAVAKYPQLDWWTQFGLFLYLLIALLIYENYRFSTFNKEIVLLFFIFYAFLVIYYFLFYVLMMIFPDAYLWGYQISEMILVFFLLFLSAYLMIYSLNLNISLRESILVSAILSLVIVGVYFYRFLIHPADLDHSSVIQIFFQRDYQCKLISIIFLLVFWVRYYRNRTTLSEYLSLIIFLFMLSTLLDSLFFALGQKETQAFVFSQFVSWVINIFLLMIWWIRLIYLKSDKAAQNEMFLRNSRMLKGLAPKPRHTFYEGLIRRISSNLMFFIISSIAGIIILIVLVREISLFLFLNLLLIIVLLILAVSIGVLSSWSDWKKQYGFFMENLNRRKKSN